VRLIELKQKNKILIFLIFIFIILLSSCNQEEGNFVLSQYNFTNTQNYEILNDNVVVQSKNGIIPSSTFNLPVFVSSNMSLSYGASFTNDSVSINQMKISNNFFNWTFPPVSFEDNDTLYFGNKNLIIPNVKMLGEKLNCEIFLEDGTIINDTIYNPTTIIQPLMEELSILNDMLLIINPIKNGENSKLSMADTFNQNKIDLFEITDLDTLDNVNDANYVLRLYKDNKALLDRELKLDLSNEYYLFTSSYLKNCDTMLLTKKVSNRALSSNLYKIK
jgi:hypothetical protein